MDLSVKYLGLQIKSPVVVGSSSLTTTIDNLKKIEKYGAGAVVLKSIFEEEVYHEYESILRSEMNEEVPDTKFLDYYDFKIKDDNIQKYLKLIADAKSSLSIPVIGSINCTSAHEWMFFAKKIEQAGADAIELNLFILPSDLSATNSETEKTFFDIIEKVQKEVSIPISVKLSFYFTNLAAFVKKLSQTGIKGLVLFNRFFHPDFDIDNFKVIPSNVLSNPSDLFLSLRWTSILSGRLDCDLIASTGVHDSDALIKQLLAGADAVQVTSTLFKNGVSYLGDMHKGLEAWMSKHGFEKIEDFKGKLSQNNSEDPAKYERAQFMKYFGDKEYDLD